MTAYYKRDRKSYLATITIKNQDGTFGIKWDDEKVIWNI